MNVQFKPLLLCLVWLFIGSCTRTENLTAPEAIQTNRIMNSFNSSTNCVPAPSGLIAWWPGDGNTDDIVGGRNGILLNGATFGSGKVEQAFSVVGNTFTGSKHVSIADDPIWTLGDNPFTIDLWVNFNVLIFTHIHGRYPFVGHSEGAGQTNKWIFWFDYRGHNTPSQPALRFHINSPTIGPIDPIFVPWTPVVGQWYHVAVTRDGDTYALYIDGVKVATDINTNTIPDPAVQLTIGGAEGLYTDGLIDEVEIFNRALSDAEIQAIFNAGAAGKCKVAIIEVEIDIKPGSDPNSINCNNSNGVIPVAILSTPDFDATTMDHSTVRFGKNGTGAAETHLDPKTSEPIRHEEDVDNDGDIDLVFHFRFEDTGIECGDEEATLTGETFDGQNVIGTDAIRTVGN